MPTPPSASNPGPLHPNYAAYHASSYLPSTCLERTDGTTYNNNNNDKHEESAHVLQQERPSLALMCVCLLKSSCMSIQHSTTNHMEGEHATSQQDRPSLSLMRAVSRPYHHAIHVMQFKEHTSSAPPIHVVWAGGCVDSSELATAAHARKLLTSLTRRRQAETLDQWSQFILR